MFIIHNYNKKVQIEIIVENEDLHTYTKSLGGMLSEQLKNISRFIF